MFDLFHKTPGKILLVSLRNFTEGAECLLYVLPSDIHYRKTLVLGET